MNRARGLTLAIVLLTLELTGWATRPLSNPAWKEVRAYEPALQVRELDASLGQGLTLGLFGGFRAVIADFLWLETNSFWERQDLPATQTMISAVVTSDPRPLYFWINGARMIAYDMPFWRFDAAGGLDQITPETRRRIEEEQAWVALALLDRALEVHPRHPLLLVEIANIHLRRRNDLLTSAAYYRLAAEQAGAPYYVARIYAEVLKKLGRHREAYDWLCAIYPKLPPDDPMAMASLVRERIKELEVELRLSTEERFNDAAR